MHIEKIATGNPKHNLFGTPEYNSWASMLQRCENPKNPSYKNYGGRGIIVCKRWHDFRNFIADMGNRPTGTSIERKKNNRGYSPTNCVWATRKEQSRNTRNTILVKIKGQTKCVRDWCKEYEINYGTVLSRIEIGIAPVKAIQTKTKK